MQFYKIFPLSVFWVASALSMQAPFNPTLNNPFDHLKHQAEGEDSYAQYKIAKAYEYGIDTKVDLEKSLVWYKKAAEKGNTKALYKLGMIYSPCLGMVYADDMCKFHYPTWIKVKKNSQQSDLFYSRAFENIKKEALRRNLVAKRNLATMYKRGRGAQINTELSNFWYERYIQNLYGALDQRDSNAMFLLGNEYQSDAYLKKDITKAVEYWKKAAEMGHVKAQYKLGLSAYGTDIDEEKKSESFDWLSRAAKNDSRKAKRDILYFCKKSLDHDHLLLQDSSQEEKEATHYQRSLEKKINTFLNQLSTLENWFSKSSPETFQSKLLSHQIKALSEKFRPSLEQILPSLNEPLFFVTVLKPTQHLSPYAVVQLKDRKFVSFNFDINQLMKEGFYIKDFEGFHRDVLSVNGIIHKLTTKPKKELFTILNTTTQSTSGISFYSLIMNDLKKILLQTQDNEDIEETLNMIQEGLILKSDCLEKVINNARQLHEELVESIIKTTPLRDRRTLELLKGYD